MALLSYSSCMVYNECPQRYKFSRIDHRPPLEGRGDITAAIPGTIAHEAAEKSLKEKGAKDFSVFDTHNLRAEALRYSEDPHVSFKDRWGSFENGFDYIQQCASNLRMFLTSENLSDKQYISEWWFGDVKEPLHLTDTCFLQGACDLIIFYPAANTAVIYDYKATRTQKWLHNEQLYTYALGAKMRTGADVHMAFFYLMPVNKQICVPVSPNDIESVKNMYIEASNKIDNKQFDPSPSDSHCRFCEYYPCSACK